MNKLLFIQENGKHNYTVNPTELIFSDFAFKKWCT